MTCWWFDGWTSERFLSEGGMIGTSSVRRVAFGSLLFPKTDFIFYRGGGLKRIEKLDTGQQQEVKDSAPVGPADGLILAASGLKRLDLTNRAVRVFSPQEMLPAVGQGIVAVECAETDWSTREILERANHAETARYARAEREMLWVLNGHCNSPIAGYSTVTQAGEMSLKGAVMSPDGKTVVQVERSGPVDKPRELVRIVAQDLLGKGAAEIIDRTRPPGH